MIAVQILFPISPQAQALMKGAESGTFPTVTIKKDAVPFEKLRCAFSHGDLGV